MDSTSIEADSAKEILQAIHKQGERFDSLESKMNSIQNDLESIKQDIGYVKNKCKEIDDRCDKLENEQVNQASAIQKNQDDIDDLYSEKNIIVQENKKTKTILGKLVADIDNLRSETDRLEQFSRRDNLRMYGIPHQKSADDFEDYSTCAQLVIETLNRVDETKAWEVKDVNRAHRTGQSLDGKPRPMIVKFSQWKDKMSILSNRQLRDKLEKKGVKVSNDLTRNQARMVAEARKDGKIAYFKKGKLVVEPRRPDSRSYAEVTARDSSSRNQTHQQTAGRTAGGVNHPSTSSRPRHQRRSSSGNSSPGGSPYRDTSGGEGETRTYGQTDRRDARKQTELRDYWSRRDDAAGGSKSQGRDGWERQQPRRSQRQRKA